MSLEQQWRDFICDPHQPGRHLAGLGRGTTSTEALGLPPSVLCGFLAKLTGAGGDAELLAEAVDLGRPGYTDFCNLHLGPLLDNLANERIGEERVVGPDLRGRPVWDRTVVARRTARIPRTHFVSRIPQRSFALPENMLLRWLVGSMGRGIEQIERRVGSAALPEGLRSIRRACAEALDHHWFRLVEVPKALSAEMIAAGSRQRHAGYRNAARLASMRAPREGKGKTAQWLRILDLLSANWLAPVRADDLFELYALTLVMDVLRVELKLGEPVEYGLVLPGRKHVARFDAGQAGDVVVFFDQSPVGAINANSRYQEVLESHSPSMGSGRRPDVIVAGRRPDGSLHPVFVEVKESRDTGYLADSVYKVFGYIHDFATLWRPDTPYPKVILLFPENIAVKASADLLSLEVAMISSFDRAGLARCLGPRLGLIPTCA